MKTLTERDTAALDELARLFTQKATADALARVKDVAGEVPALHDQIRKLRAERDDALLAAERAAKAASVGAAPARRASAPAALEVDDEAGLSLAAAFRVAPRDVKAAKDDPLVALAVQVARTMGPEAKEIERARLLAMALAATKGDMDAFWAARRMRTTKAPAAGAATKKK